MFDVIYQKLVAVLSGGFFKYSIRFGEVLFISRKISTG